MFNFLPGENFAAADTIGARKQQEDSCKFEALNGGSELLAVLADGMGGHAAGEVASQVAVLGFIRSFRSQPSLSVPGRLATALTAANREIEEAIRKSPSLEGMGCTLVAVHISEDGISWISVGDSPLFLVRGKSIRQINEDHSMAPEIALRLREGRITKQEAESHPSRNALRSALLGDGAPQLIDNPTTPLRWRDGDVLISASDGLQTLTNSQIAKIANEHTSAGAVADGLIRQVVYVKKPRQDNATVQVMKFGTGQVGSNVLNRWLIWPAIGLGVGTALLLALYLVLANHAAALKPLAKLPSGISGFASNLFHKGRDDVRHKEEVFQPVNTEPVAVPTLAPASTKSDKSSVKKPGIAKPASTTPAGPKEAMPTKDKVALPIPVVKEPTLPIKPVGDTKKPDAITAPQNAPPTSAVPPEKNIAKTTKLGNL